MEGCNVNNFTVLPSSLAYLFGDVLKALFPTQSRLSFGEKLPCRDVKVKRKDLAKAMVLTAFVHLARQGHLTLTLSKKGRIIKRKFVLAARSGSPAGGFGGLEGQLMGVVRKDPKHNDVASVVWRLWSDDVTDPFGDVLHMGQAYLRGQGYFSEGERRGIAKILGKKLVPECDRILALQGEASLIQDMIAAFRAEQPELYVQLWKDVGKGIASRQEASDDDVDFDS